MVISRATVAVALAALLGGIAVKSSPLSVGAVARAILPKHWIVDLNGYRFGYRSDHSIRIPMQDGVKLAASLYLPHPLSSPVGTIYVRHTYGRLAYGEGLQAAEFFGGHGFAVLVQDVRGKFDSEGDFLPYQHATDDGAATLDWIVKQPWSNGKVGTWGCSALGELQFSLARAAHPAHAAMVPIGAGGAAGSVAGRYGYFGVFEGGIFQLASGLGWFLQNGAIRPARPPHVTDLPNLLGQLPVADLVDRVSSDANGYDAFVSKPLTDPFWASLDYVADGDRLETPALIINTWGDQTVSESLLLANYMRQSVPGNAANVHVVIGPGSHCQHDGIGEDGKFGDLRVEDAGRPYFDWYVQWFDYWLRNHGARPNLPAYNYFVIGEDRWLNAETWPPPEASRQRWYLSSGGHANSRDGDGVLSAAPAAAASADVFTYDPMRPVPTRGGPMCCTGNPADRQGPVDQHDVETRDDVLVYTSAPLPEAVRIAGPVRADLVVESSAPDTDFVCRLVHVWPDGRATTIQEGALRARYRDGIATPRPLQPGHSTTLTVNMRDIAYTVPKGHRLRLDVSSSSFPRLERNLNGGGDNARSATPIVAVNSVIHGPESLSSVELWVLPAAGEEGR